MNLFQYYLGSTDPCHFKELADANPCLGMDWLILLRILQTDFIADPSAEGSTVDF